MKIRVTVVHALPQAQAVVEVELEEGATVGDALDAPAVRQAMPAATSAAGVGIWGAPATLASPLRDRDRVELYRPLVADPKEARRARAEKQKKRAAR